MIFPPGPDIFEKLWPTHGIKLWRLIFTLSLVIFLGGLSVAAFKIWELAFPVSPTQAMAPQPPIISKRSAVSRAPAPPVQRANDGKAILRAAPEKVLTASEEDILCDLNNRTRPADQCDRANRSGYRYRREHQSAPTMACDATSTQQSGGVTACVVGNVNQ